jgi:hypothetical protein
MPTRSERRRATREALSGAEAPFGRRPLLRGRDLFIAAAIVGGIISVALAAFLLVIRGEDSVDTSIFVARSPDEKAIEELARRSIEVLPKGQWPSLYASFTPEYQQRCPEQEFAEAGVAGAQAVGVNLPLLRFKRLENVSVESSAASAVIVGEVEGQSEYSLQGAFQNVAGAWKIAPAPSTQGCEAFERITG